MSKKPWLAPRLASWRVIPCDFGDPATWEEYRSRADQLVSLGVEVEMFSRGYLGVRAHVFPWLLLWFVGHGMNRCWCFDPPEPAGPLRDDGRPMHFEEYVRTFVLPVQKEGADEQPHSPAPS